MIGAILSAVTSRAGAIASASAAILLSFLLLGATLKVNGLKHDLKARDAQLATANQDLGTCHANVTVMQSAIDGQNASILAAKAKGDQIAADAEKAASEARSALQRAKAASVRISAPLVSTGVCERVAELDARYLKGRL